MDEEKKEYLRKLMDGVRKQALLDPDTVKAREEIGRDLITNRWMDAMLLCDVVENEVLGAARDSRLFDRLSKNDGQTIGNWSRDDLYDRSKKGIAKGALKGIETDAIMTDEDSRDSILE